MSGVIEKYYTVQQLAWLLEFDRKTVGRWVLDGKFGDQVLRFEGNDVRVPASGVNFYLANCRVLAHGHQNTEPVAARTAGELKRKVGI